MKNLNKNQWIAVFSGLAFLGYLMFPGSIMNLFNLSSEELDTQAPATGFVTEEITVGTGPLAEAGDILTVHYTGRLADGRVFDSSLDSNTPITFTLGAGQVIRGWDEGLIGMRVGGKRLLIIAPDYAYGQAGIGTIPPNSVLTFEVELLNAEKPASR